MEENDVKGPEKKEMEKKTDVFGEVFSFRNVLLCAIVLGGIIVLLNLF